MKPLQIGITGECGIVGEPDLGSITRYRPPQVCSPPKLDEVGIGPENREQLRVSFTRLGFIEMTKIGHLHLRIYAISPMVVQYARQIELAERQKSEGKDIVESVKTTLRKHPVAGVVVVIFAAVVTLATAITQIAGALKVLGLIADK